MRELNIILLAVFTTALVQAADQTIGSTTVDRLPQDRNREYTLQLNGLDHTSIGFLDTGHSAASIRYQGATGFTIGGDDGWGVKNVAMPGHITVGGNLTFGGSNSWMVHTPEDDRKILTFGHLVDGAWQWPFVFKNDGSLHAIGNLRAQGYLWTATDVNVGRDVWASGNVTAKGNLSAHTIYNNGFDFVLGKGDQSSRGNTGHSRALVKDVGEILTLNYGGDFKGGVNVGSKLMVNGDVNANRHVNAGGYIWTAGSVNAAGNVNSNSDVNSAKNVNANGYIWSATDVHAARHLNASGNVNASGYIWTAGSVNAWGSLTIGAGQSVYSPGRMHINGEEHLYLLNKSGVSVSKAWGGNGNLTVEGTTRSSSVITSHLLVRQTWWGDFVFADDYRLMPLPELKRYIQANKHLPGVPDEATILKDGIQVNDMLATHMVKIEELTLHTISQQEAIDALQAANAKLLARLERLEAASGITPMQDR